MNNFNKIKNLSINIEKVQELLVLVRLFKNPLSYSLLRHLKLNKLETVNELTQLFQKDDQSIISQQLTKLLNANLISMKIDKSYHRYYVSLSNSENYDVLVKGVIGLCKICKLNQGNGYKAAELLFKILRCPVRTSVLDFIAKNPNCNINTIYKHNSLKLEQSQTSLYVKDFVQFGLCDYHIIGRKVKVSLNNVLIVKVLAEIDEILNNIKNG